MLDSMLGVLRAPPSTPFSNYMAQNGFMSSNAGYSLVADYQ